MSTLEIATCASPPIGKLPRRINVFALSVPENPAHLCDFEPSLEASAWSHHSKNRYIFAHSLTPRNHTSCQKHSLIVPKHYANPKCTTWLTSANIRCHKRSIRFRVSTNNAFWLSAPSKSPAALHPGLAQKHRYHRASYSQTYAPGFVPSTPLSYPH
jgi:hypothetical protein